jgi:2-dehydro-3-deoxyphosphogluconate aldolase/(4S)-4-hydroxy-2-oxoglutarate aldolase
MADVTGMIESARLVAILRAGSDKGLVDACRAMAEGGVRVAEVPLTTPNALKVVSQIANELGDRVLIGTGSVLDAEGVKRSADTGARFIVSPITKAQVIETSHDLGLPCLPGALTPTEVQAAWELGADIVKVFPAHRVGGPAYIRELLAPLPHLKLMPTGGVRLESAGDWLDAGAVCLGVGTSLFRPDLIDAGDWSGLTAHARAFVAVARALETGGNA